MNQEHAPEPLSGPQSDSAKGAARTYTVEQAAPMSGLGRAAFYAGCHRGEIPSLRVGRRLLIPKFAFHQWLDGITEEISP